MLPEEQEMMQAIELYFTMPEPPPVDYPSDALAEIREGQAIGFQFRD